MNGTKRIKEDEEQIEMDFDYVEKKFRGNCYCDISIAVAQRILRFIEKRYLEPVQSTWPRDRILAFLNCIQLMCASIGEQYCAGSTCRNISKLRKIIVEKRNQLIDFLIAIVNIRDQSITFASARALTSCFILLDTKVERMWIEKLCAYINEESPESARMCFSLNVMKNIIGWKDFGERTTLEENARSDGNEVECRSTTVACESFECEKLKSNCIESLHSRWTSVAHNFSTILTDQNGDRRCNVIAFLNLWRELVSVKNDSKVMTTEHFYRNLQYLLPSSSSNAISPLVWKHLIDVVNEVLCYGTTISLQGEVDQNTLELTMAVVNKVRRGHLLNMIPCSVGNQVSVGGPVEGCDMVLVKKAALMVLKAVAVTVRDAKTDSSSDSSAASDDEDGEQNPRVIEQYVYEMLKKLDTFVKRYSAFHPEMKMAQWIVQLFVDQGDYLFESMVCCLDMFDGLCFPNDSTLELQKMLDPYVTFISLLETVHFDYSMVLALLLDDVRFFLYFHRLLKYIKRNPRGLLKSCLEKDPSANVFLHVYAVIEMLKISVESLVTNGRCPPRIDIDPVLENLKTCEQLIRMFIAHSLHEEISHFNIF